MKKAMLIFTILIILLIHFVIGFKSTTIENKVYPHNIDFSVYDYRNDIEFDNTLIIDKSKELLNLIYPEVDFNKFSVNVKTLSENFIYVYFQEGDIKKYYVSFKIDEGALSGIGRILNESINNKSNSRTIEQLRSDTIENIKKLQIVEIDYYNIVKEINDGEVYLSYYFNSYTNRMIATITDLTTGELIDFNFYYASSGDL